MFKIICVTNRKLCSEDFLGRIKRLISSGIKTIVLREKDLNDAEYEVLAREVMKLCDEKNVRCILHSHVEVALKLKPKGVHLPLHEIEKLDETGRLKTFLSEFDFVGTSCHSVTEAKRAEALGCKYIFAGHIFETDCKAGTPGRGLDFLREVINSIKIPVYAIGGISPENVEIVMKSGALGACVMSGFTQDEPMVFDV